MQSPITRLVCEDSLMSLRLKLNVIAASILLLGLLAVGALMYRAGDDSARAQVLKELTTIKALMLSVREYTSNEVRPLLEDASNIQFLAQTVPAFGGKIHVCKLSRQIS